MAMFFLLLILLQHLERSHTTKREQKTTSFTKMCTRWKKKSTHVCVIHTVLHYDVSSCLTAISFGLLFLSIKSSRVPHIEFPCGMWCTQWNGNSYRSGKSNENDTIVLWLGWHFTCKSHCAAFGSHNGNVLNDINRARERAKERDWETKREDSLNVRLQLIRIQIQRISPVNVNERTEKWHNY